MSVGICKACVDAADTNQPNLHCKMNNKSPEQKAKCVCQCRPGELVIAEPTKKPAPANTPPVTVTTEQMQEVPYGWKAGDIDTTGFLSIP